jgi:hypothetical protein
VAVAAADLAGTTAQCRRSWLAVLGAGPAFTRPVAVQQSAPMARHPPLAVMVRQRIAGVAVVAAVAAERL